MKRILTFALSAALVLGAAALWAQPGFHHKMGGPGGMTAGQMADHMEFMARALDLTDEQKAAAKKIHEEIFAKAEPLMEQHRQQMDEVHALLEGAHPDATTVGQKVIEAHATGEQLKALHEEAMAKFSALLNADQQAKLKKFQEMHHDRDGDGPPGPGF
jgi:Spy/CpxP family protein refolding chaperone